MAVISRTPGWTFARGGTKHTQRADAVSVVIPNADDTKRRRTNTIARISAIAVSTISVIPGVGMRASAIFNAPSHRTDPAIACTAEPAMRAGIHAISSDKVLRTNADIEVISAISVSGTARMFAGSETIVARWK